MYPVFGETIIELQGHHLLNLWLIPCYFGRLLDLGRIRLGRVFV